MSQVFADACMRRPLFSPWDHTQCAPMSTGRCIPNTALSDAPPPPPPPFPRIAPQCCNNISARGVGTPVHEWRRREGDEQNVGYHFCDQGV